MAVEYVDRPPRIQPDLPVGEVPIPNPPEAAKAGETGMMAIIMPIITIVGFLFVSGSGNVLFIIPMGLAMLMSVGATIFGARGERKVFAAKQKAYAELLAELRQEMTRSHNVQRLFYQHNFPDIPSVIDIAARTEISRFGSRLWERRPADADFGFVRLGLGNRPSTVAYKVSSTGTGDADSPLQKDAQQLMLDSQVLEGAAITIPLRPIVRPGGADAEEAAGAARHAIGIFGKNPTNIADFVRGMLTHFTAFHSALDTRLYVVGLPQNRTGWQWAEWLPHATERGVTEDSDSNQAKHYDQLCFSPDKAEVSEFW
jgi:S-DNA-T family DNA segregation ATPase FtsK/SpoIIIE